jgi:hypothetical protein
MVVGIILCHEPDFQKFVTHTFDRNYTAMHTHTYDGLFICQLYSLPDLLEEMDCKEDMPLTLPFCIVCFLLTVDNSDMNYDKCWYNNSVSYGHF